MEKNAIFDSSTEPSAELKAHLRRGPEQHVFWAERALLLHRKIGDHAAAINRASYGEFFATVQMMAIDRAVLAITKMYERPGSYPIRSIPAALSFLRDHVDHIPIVDVPAASAAAARVGVQIDTLPADGTHPDLSKALITAMLQACPSPDSTSHDKLCSALASLKARRDKSIAHDEIIAAEKMPRSTWDDATALIAFGKRVLHFIGAGFLRLTYFDDSDRYALDLDAHKASTCAHRIIDMIVSPTGHPER